MDRSPKQALNQKKKVDSAQTATRTIKSAITNTFKNSLKEFEKTKHQLQIGDLVLAKMSGFEPWPGKITSFSKDKRMAKCFFYGSHDNGPVGVRQIIPFKDGLDTIRLVKLRHLVNFEKGIREIEFKLGVPESMSSLRETASIQ